jgi:cyclase
MRTRLIGNLQIKGNNVVKPIYFEGLKIIGSPIKLAKQYYNNGLDELFLTDIVSSLYQRSIDYNLIKKISDNVLIPITVGGGIKSVEQISELLEHGADKICINTYALQNKPNFINQAIKRFGSQSIIGNIETKKIKNDWFCLSDGGRVLSKKKVFNWMKELEDRGVGEILLQSVDKDGSMKGFDLDFLYKVKDLVNIPIIVSGGAGKIDHIKKLKKEINPDAVCVSSVLHYKKIKIKDIKKYL